MDISDFLRDELDIKEALDIANVDDIYNEGEREIEVFCSWEGTVFNINYPTKASGWTRLEDTSSTKTSHGRWEYYDKTLFLISKHCSCLGCPFPIQLCQNCDNRDRWRKSCETPTEVYYLFNPTSNVEDCIDLPLLVNKKINLNDYQINKYLDIMPAPLFKLPAKKAKNSKSCAPCKTVDNRLDELSTIRPVECDFNEISGRLTHMQMFNGNTVHTLLLRMLREIVTARTCTNEVYNAVVQLMALNSPGPLLFETDIWGNCGRKTFIYLNNELIPWILSCKQEMGFAFVNARGLLHDLVFYDMLCESFLTTVHVISANIHSICESGELAFVVLVSGQSPKECLTIPPKRGMLMPVGFIEV